MKNLIRLCGLMFCCLGLFGCPYESPVPISDPSIPIDEGLLGMWHSKDEVYNDYTVTRASATEYHILQKNSIGNTSRYKGFLSEVKGVMFLNLFSDSTNSYYLYRLRMDAINNKFILLPLSEHLSEHFGSKEGLRNYLEKNLNFQSIYNEAERSEFQKISSQATSSL